MRSCAPIRAYAGAYVYVYVYVCVCAQARFFRIYAHNVRDVRLWAVSERAYTRDVRNLVEVRGRFGSHF